MFVGLTILFIIVSLNTDYQCNKNITLEYRYIMSDIHVISYTYLIYNFPRF